MRTEIQNVNGFFAREFQLLSYDASGYGRSTAPLENYSVEAWAERLRGCSSSCISRASLCWGHRWGA